MSATEKYPDNVVRDAGNQPFVFDCITAAYDTAKAVEEHLGYSLEVHYSHSEKMHCWLVPHHERQQKPLTVPERAVVSAFAWQAAKYMRGMERQSSFTFPKLVHTAGDRAVLGNDNDFLTFADEARAYQFMEVCEKVFGVDAQVLDTPGGWAVAVSEGDYEIDMVEMHRLQGACAVLCEYSLASAESAAISNRRERQPYPEARRQPQAIRKQEEALRRIEAGLGAILSRLGEQYAALAAQPHLNGNEAIAQPTPAAKPAKPAKATARRATAGQKAVAV